MNITQSDYKNLLKEYEEKQLRNLSISRERKEQLYEKLPRLKEIEAEIASLYVKRTSFKLRGASFYCDNTLSALKKEKDEILKENGLTADDFEAVYDCLVCKDTGFTDEGPCSCFKARITEILYDQSNIREVLKKENFESFNLDYYSEEPLKENPQLSERKLAIRALEASKSFVSNFKTSNENLLISGGCGVGKTFLSNCIAKEIIEDGSYVIYLSSIKLFDIFSNSVFEKDKTSQDIIKHVYDCDLLIIDDLGTEFSNSFTVSSLFGCINERLGSGKHTIISTNLSARQLREIYSERIFSRITNNYTMIKLLGSDIRIKKRLEN